jgi:hypothetical protein
MLLHYIRHMVLTPKKNIDDNVFGNSAIDLANETVRITNKENFLQGNYTIGITL